MKKIIDFEIIDHGPEYSQYFQGCGTAFTDYDICITGCGNSAFDAFEDMLEQVAQMDYDSEELEKEIKEVYDIKDISAETVCDITNCENRKLYNGCSDCEDYNNCDACPNESYSECGDSEDCENCELYYYLSVRIKEGE